MKNFDVIIPVGSLCITAEVLEKRGLRKCSLPFDWIKPLNFSKAVNLIATNFERFFLKTDLVKSQELPHTIGYTNTYTGLVHLHDFPKNSDFDQAFGDIQEKYNRRINRLYEKIEHNNNILLFHIHHPEIYTNAIDVSVENLSHELDKLKKLYPTKKISLLYVKLNNGKFPQFYTQTCQKNGVFLYEAFRDKSVKENRSGFKQFIPSVQYILDDFFAVSSFYKIKRKLRRMLKIPISILSLLIPSKKIRHQLKIYTKRF